VVQVRDTVTAWKTGNKPPAFVIEKNGVVIKNLANLLPHPRRMAMLRPERLPAPLPLHQLGNSRGLARGSRSGEGHRARLEVPHETQMKPFFASTKLDSAIQF
jgi:hypothetical protein